MRNEEGKLSHEDYDYMYMVEGSVVRKINFSLCKDMDFVYMMVGLVVRKVNFPLLLYILNDYLIRM